MQAASLIIRWRSGDFLAEEPSEYGLSCIGSRGMTGSLDDKMLDPTEPGGGEGLRDAVGRVGGDPTRLNRSATR